MSITKRTEFLRSQFSKIDGDVFEQIISADPSVEKKYSTWLLRLYSKSNLNLNDLPTLKEVISLHSSLKDKIPVEFRDINKFDSVVSFLFSINVWFTNRFVENEKNTNYLKNGGELIFENNNIEIVKILSFEGSVAFGSGTKWCTLQQSSYYEYSQKGDLYIVTPKSELYKGGFGKKSQLHFLKQEFRNHLNEEIDLIECLISFPELYEPIKSIQLLKENTDLGHFLCLKESSISLNYCVKIRGYRILKFIDNLSKEFIDGLFSEFGEEAYEFIPDSKDKTISFVSAVSDGLKKLLKLGNVEIDEETFHDAVVSYPENILLMNCNDEGLWEYAVMQEAWLVKRSPFINDGNKLLPLVRENFIILKYIVPVEIFTPEQIEQIAENLVGDYCDNYLEYLPRLGELSEKAQLKLVTALPDSVNYFVCPSDKAVKLSEKLIKDKKEEDERFRKVAEKAEKDRREHIEKDSNFLEKIIKDYYSEILVNDFVDYEHYDYNGKTKREMWIDSQGSTYVQYSDGTINKIFDDFKNLDIDEPGTWSGTV